MASPKRTAKRRASTQRHLIDDEALIRHHIEEASTHLAAIKAKKKLLAEEELRFLKKYGKGLMLIYTHHGGIKH